MAGIQTVGRRMGWSAAFELLSGLQPDVKADLATWADRLATTQRPDGGWTERASQTGSDADTSVLNHVALATFLRRVAHAREFPEAYRPDASERVDPERQFATAYPAEYRSRLTLQDERLRHLETALARSWAHLTGVLPHNDEELYGPLPGRVLRPLHAPSRAVHEALLGDSVAVRVDPEGSVASALSLVQKGLNGKPLDAAPGRETLLRRLGQAAGLGLTAAAVLAAPHILLPLLGGVATGLTVSSTVECWFHDHVGHATDMATSSTGELVPLKPGATPSLVRQVAEKGPSWARRPLQNLYFGHSIIHHFRTFSKYHTIMFKSPEDRTKVDAFAKKQGRGWVIADEYGVTLNWKSAAKYLGVGTLAFAPVLAGALALGAGPLFAAGFAAPALMFPMASKYYHRYTHMPAKEALQTASLPMRQYLVLPLSRYTVAHHFVHHRKVKTNENLLWPVGDILLGKKVDPTVGEQEEMRRQHLLY